MTDIGFYINRWLMPVFLTFFFIQLRKSRKELHQKIEKLKNQRIKYVATLLYDSLSLRYENLKDSILLPVFSVILLDVVLSLIFHMPLHSSGESFLFASLTSGFMNPVSEEWIFRGMLLGGMVNLLIKPNTKREYRFLISVLGLIAVSYAFTISHNNLTNFQVILRFTNSIIYGSLYLRERNLFPTIIAHATNNWFLILNDAFA